MDQTTSPEQIRHDIDQRRGQMTRDVDEIEARAKSLTDWRQQVQERPLAAAGVAASAGLVLGLLTGGSDDSKESRDWSQRQPYYYRSNGDGQDDGARRWITGEGGNNQATQAGQHRAAGKVDEIRGALMGLAATKAQEFLREALPGYAEEEQKVSQQKEHEAHHDGDEHASHTSSRHSRESEGSTGVDRR